MGKAYFVLKFRIFYLNPCKQTLASVKYTHILKFYCIFRFQQGSFLDQAKLSFKFFHRWDYIFRQIFFFITLQSNV